MIQEIPQLGRKKLRPNLEGSGLELEANMDFQDHDDFDAC